MQAALNGLAQKFLVAFWPQIEAALIAAAGNLARDVIARAKARRFRRSMPSLKPSSLWTRRVLVAVVPRHTEPHAIRPTLELQRVSRSGETDLDGCSKNRGQ